MTDTAERTKRVFASKRQLLALTCPEGRDSVEYWHESVAGFGVRIMAPDANGKVRRTYLCRYSEQEPDGKGGFKKKDKKERIGLVEELDGEPAISFDDALEQALAKRRVLKEQKKDGGASRLSVGKAWGLYASEKRLNRDATLEKDEKTFNRFLCHLGDKFLDELHYPFWANMVSQLKAGTLQVGTMLSDGVEVPDMRGPIADATMLAVLNVASNLYEIAHKHKGIKKLEAKENPPRDAKALVGTPNKRRTLIPLKKLGVAWRCSHSVVAPGFRDLFQVFVLTGLRRSLVLDMRFSEIDFETGTYVIDPRKRGTKRRGKDIPEHPEPIRLPLSGYVMDLLNARREFAPDKNGLVFYSRPTKGKAAKGGGMTDPRSSWEPIEEAIGLHFTPHDLRRTFATLGSVATKGTDLFSLSLLMLHTGSTLAAAVGLPAITVDYINTDEAQEKMRAVAEAITQYTLKLVQDKATAPQQEPKLPGFIEAALAEE